MDIVQLSGGRFINLANICDVEFDTDHGETKATVYFSGASAVYTGLDADNLREALEDAAEESAYLGFRDTEPEDEDDWTPSEEYELGGEGGHGS